MDQDATCYTEVNLGPGDVVLDGVAAPPKRGAAGQFSAHVYCGQTVGWMKTPLGTEVDLGPAHIVLDGDPAAPAKGAQQPPPSLRPMSIVATVARSATAELFLVYVERYWPTSVRTLYTLNFDCHN